MVVSSTSMNVGMTTAMATIHGLKARRSVKLGARAKLVMQVLRLFQATALFYRPFADLPILHRPQSVQALFPLNEEGKGCGWFGSQIATGFGGLPMYTNGRVD